MMAATYFIEECNRRSTHAGHTYGILKLKGILWPVCLFFRQLIVDVSQWHKLAQHARVAIWSFEWLPHALIKSKIY